MCPCVVKMIRNSRESLADKIADVLNTAPTSFDPEDHNLDNTHAQLLNADLFGQNDDEGELLSAFRKENVELLVDVDARYAGVKTSRRELAGSDEDSSDSYESAYEGNVAKTFETNSVENGIDKNAMELSSEDDKGASVEDGSDEEESKGKEETEEEDSTSDYETYFGDESPIVKEDTFRIMKEIDIPAQVKKGLCVRDQISMWESLLETRIQLQKCLVSANKMPQKATFNEIKKSSGEEFSNQFAVTKNSLVNVLDKLLQLQKLVLKKYPETKNLCKNQQKDVNEDEEIPSDTDDEQSAEAVEELEEEIEDIPKKRKLNDFERKISEGYNTYKNYRNSVIQKWNEKTRVAVINSPNSHSVIDHIEHALSDKAKLIKRTQLKRSEYTVLGQIPVELDEQQKEETHTSRISEEYNTEIFDDDDFYHQLLRELIEVKSADVTDPVQLSRQWIQLQKLRGKMKRKIDTRATKGRKIRYAVHSKLINFMAPVNEYLWTDEAKSELFSSLFGKKES